MGRKKAARYSKLKATEWQTLAAYKGATPTHKVPRAASPVARKRHIVGISSFGLDMAIGTYAKTSMTAQADAIREKISGLTHAVLGIEKDPANMLGLTPGDVQWYPALFIPTLVDAAQTTATSGTSAFTGRKTSNWKTRSGSIPFGQVAATKTDASKKTPALDSYGEQRAKILEVISTATISGAKLKTYTFQPEVLKPKSSGATGVLPATPIPITF